MTGQHAAHRRIHSVITRSAILHVEDALAIGKLRLFALSYEKGKGAKAHIAHYLDLADARPLLQDLAAGGLPEPYTEYKGSRDGEGAVSRVLTVKDKPEARSPIIVELASGPGEVIGQGAIKPKGKPTTQVAVFLSRWEARKLALAVLEHLQARAVAEALCMSGPESEVETELSAAAEIEILAEDEPFDRPEQAPATEAASHADATGFWRTAYARGLSQAEGAELLRQSGGDWSKALSLLPAR